MRRLEFTAKLEKELPIYMYMDYIHLAKFHLPDGRDIVVSNEGYSLGIEDGYLHLTWYRPSTVDSQSWLFKDYGISCMTDEEVYSLLKGATVEFILSSFAPEDIQFGEITFRFVGREFKKKEDLICQ